MFSRTQPQNVIKNISWPLFRSSLRKFWGFGVSPRPLSGGVFQLQSFMLPLSKFRIRSNKSPGCLTKSLRVFFARINPKNPNKYSSRPSWLMDMDIWLIILWLIISKFLKWALIGAWAAIDMNMVHQFAFYPLKVFDIANYKNSCLKHLKMDIVLTYHYHNFCSVFLPKLDSPSCHSGDSTGSLLFDDYFSKSDGKFYQDGPS